MCRLIAILIFFSQCFLINAQDVRAHYDAEYQKQKQVIDSLSGASLTTVGAIIGFELPKSYMGIFPVDGQLTPTSNIHKKVAVAAGDTFYTQSVTWPRMNPPLTIPNSDEQYVAHYKLKPKDYLIESEAYKQVIANLKKSKVKPIIPVWGALFCNEMDDDGPEAKNEKYYINSDSWSFHFKVIRNNEITKLDFALNFSMNKDATRLESYGCAVPEESYVRLEFADGSNFKKTHEGNEESCYTLSTTLSDEDKKILKKKVVKIEFSLSKKKLIQTITDPMQGDLIGLKLDCVE